MRNLFLFWALVLFTFSCTKPENDIKINTDNKFVRITPVEKPSNLTSFWFFNELNGYISSTSNKLLKTNDGGNSYKGTIINGSNSLENLYFFSPDLGFCTDPDFKTFRFGEPRWSEYPFPIKETYPSCIQVLNESIFFATTVMGKNESAFLVNQISGTAWDTLFAYKGNLKQIEMANDSTGFLLANGESDVALFKTSDGGKSWTNKIQSFYQSYFDASSQLKKLIIIDKNNIIAIGRGAASNEGFILTSADGGENWTYAYTNQALNDFCIIDNDIYFAGTDLFIAKWQINISQINTPSQIVENWIPFNRETDFLNSETGDKPARYHNIIQVQFVDSKTGFILTNDENELFKIKLVP